jgi:hypothetical protein
VTKYERVVEIVEVGTTAKPSYPQPFWKNLHFSHIMMKIYDHDNCAQTPPVREVWYHNEQVAMRCHFIQECVTVIPQHMKADKQTVVHGTQLNHNPSKQTNKHYKCTQLQIISYCLPIMVALYYYILAVKYQGSFGGLPKIIAENNCGWLQMLPDVMRV